MIPNVFVINRKSRNVKTYDKKIFCLQILYSKEEETFYLINFVHVTSECTNKSGNRKYKH